MTILNELFTRAEYCQRLESQRLKFTKGMNINNFSTDLKICAKEGYKLIQVNDKAIEAIAINHVLAKLDDDIKCDKKHYGWQEIGP